jgi:chromosomal replication initiation ATPase DnaA
MLSKNKNEKLKNYRQFISLEDDEKISQVLDKKKWPAILGSADFIAKVKEKFFSETVDDEVPQARELAPETDQIKRVVCDRYGISEKELLISKRGLSNEARNMAIYLTRRLRGDSLKTIGEQFQVGKYSSVSSVIRRLNAAMADDRRLRTQVEELILVLKKGRKQNR